jgi:hypothetical protein
MNLLSFILPSFQSCIFWDKTSLPAFKVTDTTQNLDPSLYKTCLSQLQKLLNWVRVGNEFIFWRLLAVLLKITHSLLRRDALLLGKFFPTFWWAAVSSSWVSGSSLLGLADPEDEGTEAVRNVGNCLDRQRYIPEYLNVKDSKLRYDERKKQI